MERKEAIEVIKKNWPDSSFTMLREALETLIPELRESEDERIRKEIISAVNLYCTSYCRGTKVREDMLAWLEKQRKSAWTEEDECYMSECIGAIATKDGWSFEEKRKTKHWLNSLKDRVQPKQKENEKDKEMFASIEQIMLDTECENGWNCVYLPDNDKEVFYSDIRNWLKTLRPQSQWKPSDVQMQVVGWCKPLLVEPKSKEILDSLINDLKKLKEE